MSSVRPTNQSISSAQSTHAVPAGSGLIRSSLSKTGQIVNANNNDISDLSVDASSGPPAWKCRANAAAGFPDFFTFAKPLVEFRNGLHPLIVDLMHDPVAAVRANMSANIHPVSFGF